MPVSAEQAEVNVLPWKLGLGLAWISSLGQTAGEVVVRHNSFLLVLLIRLASAVLAEAVAYAAPLLERIGAAAPILVGFRFESVALVTVLIRITRHFLDPPEVCNP